MLEYKMVLFLKFVLEEKKTEENETFHCYKEYEVSIKSNILFHTILATKISDCEL